MGLFEALEATESPHTIVVFVWVFVGTLGYFGTHLSLGTVLAQLLDQMFDIESGGIVEQAHLVEDATNVAAGFAVIGEVPFLVFIDGLFRDIQRLGANWSIAGEIFLRLDTPFSSECLRRIVKN